MKAALYIRVSTSEQAKEGYSLAAQENTLKRFCEMQEFEIYKVYADEGISAKNIKKREKLQQMLKETEQFDVVVIWKISRMARNMKDLLNIEESLRDNDVALISVTEPFDATTYVGKFIFQILGAVAELEREILAENISNALKEKTSQGKRNFTNILGYDIVNKKIKPNKKEQKLVKKIFLTYKETVNLSGTARIINKLGYKGLRNKPFTANSISVILNNTNYIGIVEHKKKEFYIAKDFQGFIDKDLFLEVQHLILENKYKNKKDFEERLKKIEEILKGLV